MIIKVLCKLRISSAGSLHIHIKRAFVHHLILLLHKMKQSCVAFFKNVVIMVSIINMLSKSTSVAARKARAHLWPSEAEEVQERTVEEEAGWKQSRWAGCEGPSPWRASSPRWAALLQPLLKRTGRWRRSWSDWSWRDGRRRRRRRWRRRTRTRRSAPSSLGRSETWIQQQNENYFHYCCNKCFWS